MAVVRYLYRTLLGLYAGALLAFSALFVPSMFSALGPAMAARVVRRCLPVLDAAGVAIGAFALLAALIHDGVPARRQWLRAGALVAVMVLAMVSLFWLTPQMMQLRLLANDDITALLPTDPIRQQFGRLHGVSATLSLLELAALLLALGFPLEQRAQVGG